jgi:hypothetical protein
MLPPTELPLAEVQLTATAAMRARVSERMRHQPQIPSSTSTRLVDVPSVAPSIRRSALDHRLRVRGSCFGRAAPIERSWIIAYPRDTRALTLRQNSPRFSDHRVAAADSQS